MWWSGWKLPDQQLHVSYYAATVSMATASQEFPGPQVFLGGVGGEKVKN